MRQGKISELIHNSANHPDLDEFSVEVHFRDIIDLVSVAISGLEIIVYDPCSLGPMRSNWFPTLSWS